MARFLIIVTLLTATLGGYRPAAASSTPGNIWRVQNPLFPIVSLQSVACPSLTTCQAAGGDMIFSTRDGGATWRHTRVHAGSQINQVVCVSASSCFVLDQVVQGRQTRGVVIRTRDGGRTWTDGSSFPQTFLGGASCPTATVCYAMGGTKFSQNVPVLLLRSDDAGASWTRVRGQALYSVSAMSITCPGPALCYLAGIDSMLVTRDAGRTWTKRVLANGAAGPVPGRSITSMTCAGISRCYAIFGDGSIMGTGDGWTTSRLLRPGDLPGQPPVNRITCPAASVCYASRYSGTMLATTNGGASWNVDETYSSNALQAIACPTPSTCTVVGDSTTILSTHDGGATWQNELRGTTSELSAVTCVDASTCTAVGAAGTILGTNNSGESWRIEDSGTHQSLDAASCPTASTCYAVGGSRYVLPAQGPVATTIGPVILRTSDGGTSWTMLARNPIGGRPLDLAGVACPSADICYATSDSGGILSTTDGGQSWQWGRTGAYFQLRGIACPTTTDCVAVGGLDAECNSVQRSARPSTFHDLDGCFAPEEGVVFVTQDGGRSWQRRYYRQLNPGGPSATGAHLFSISCPSPTTCLAAGHNIVVKTVDGGQTWHFATTKPLPTTQPFGGPGWPNAVSLACPSPTTCWASYGIPTPARTVDGGRTWTPGPTNPKPRAGPVFGLACPTLDTCYAVGGSGLILRLIGVKSMGADTVSAGLSRGW